VLTGMVTSCQGVQGLETRGVQGLGAGAAGLQADADPDAGRIVLPRGVAAVRDLWGRTCGWRRRERWGRS
jgi:hypothetical protein